VFYHHPGYVAGPQYQRGCLLQELLAVREGQGLQAAHGGGAAHQHPSQSLCSHPCEHWSKTPWLFPLNPSLAEKGKSDLVSNIPLIILKIPMAMHFDKFC
jgi:hypothetical protein